MDSLSKIQKDFIGLNTKYTLANGEKTRRIYLDSTASTLMMGAANDAIKSFYHHYANTHSLLHFSAKISTNEYRFAHERILSFVQADPNDYTCFFTGSGTTAGMNRLARVFRDYRPHHPIAVISLMEHHSNDLPHRKHAKKVVHVPLTNHGGEPGCINMDALEEILRKHSGQVNYVAMTGVSNVTGIINPIYDIAELAHTYGALMLVDGAQMVAHLPVKISGYENPLRNIDAFVFSGHKTYVPGSPGVVICRKDILSSIEPEEVGGGMVDRVFVEKYTITETFPDREEAGTPNIPGAIGLAAALEVMDRIGMETIFEEETELISDAMEKMKLIHDVHIYGETDCNICPRAASISFNIAGMDHGLVAAVLNDYYNIAVRNECFCAHPYVQEMILEDVMIEYPEINDNVYKPEYKIKAGMVRASFGLYNTTKDVDFLINALNDIIVKRELYKTKYSINEDGNYVHESFRPNMEREFTISGFVDDYFQSR
ncbi:MAG: aminotransferase class V-fold PLP-dependent enzyme [Candidatus Marinimicrobia bacterium]|nr:aminotransferase class V-fold PLP-dependent enzyme [Candidatus Neomarinimicrobiota bacterium]